MHHRNRQDITTIPAGSLHTGASPLQERCPMLSRQCQAITTRIAYALALFFCTAFVHAQGAGYSHTTEAQILDANGTAVRIAGINWYGFETTDLVVHGLNAQDYKTVRETTQSAHYNSTLIPFSSQMVESPI